MCHSVKPDCSGIAESCVCVCQASIFRIVGIFHFPARRAMKMLRCIVLYCIHIFGWSTERSGYDAQRQYVYNCTYKYTRIRRTEYIHTTFTRTLVTRNIASHSPARDMFDDGSAESLC